jgi:hypothetical protein
VWSAVVWNVPVRDFDNGCLVCAWLGKKMRAPVTYQ